MSPTARVSLLFSNFHFFPTTKSRKMSSFVLGGTIHIPERISLYFPFMFLMIWQPLLGISEEGRCEFVLLADTVILPGQSTRLGLGRPCDSKPEASRLVDW